MKKVAAVIIPVAAFAALAGTGFGAWYFASNGASADASASVTVTASEDKTGTLSFGTSKSGDYPSIPSMNPFTAMTDNTFYLILDQKHDAYWSKTSTESTDDAAAETAAKAPNQFSYVHVKYEIDSSVTQYQEILMGFELSMKMEITEGKETFDKYLKFDDSTQLEHTFSYNNGLQPRANESTWTMMPELYALYQVPTVSFKSKPDSLTAYNNMVNEMKSVKFKVTGTMNFIDANV